MNIMLMQAMSAMMSGQSPQQFLQTLAQNNTQLQGMDFNNLESTARNLAQSKGVDVNQALGQLQNILPK